MSGLRERKKQRTRRRLADAALRLFGDRGFEGTTVEAICDEAEVAVSTFYVYFPSKEAAAFPDEEARVAAVAATLRDRPAGQPMHISLRRAAHAVVQQDLTAQDALASRLQLLAREPALAAYAARGQARYAGELAALFADQLGVDPAIDVRPRLLVSAVLGALDSAYGAWAADSSRDLGELVDEAFDLLDAGFARSLASLTAGARGSGG